MQQWTLSIPRVSSKLLSMVPRCPDCKGWEGEERVNNECQRHEHTSELKKT